MGIKYCNNCNQRVSASRKGIGAGFVFLIFGTIAMLGIGLFVGLAGITIMGAIVVIMWIIYWLAYTAKLSICPICKDSNWGSPAPENPVKVGAEPDLEQSRNITYNKWSHRPYHVLGMTMGGVVALVLIVNAATYEAPLTPEQKAEVATTPLTQEQLYELNDSYNNCALYTSFSAEAFRECLKQIEERILDMRRDNWEAQQND